MNPESSPPGQSVAEAVLAEMATPEAPEAPEASTAAPEAPEAPEDASEDEVEIEHAGRTRQLSWADALKQVPPDIRALMKQMQGDYTRKTMELAEQRKEFKREREALLAGSQALKQEQAELPEYDPFNEETINARIEQEVSRRLREVLEPMEREYQAMAAEDAYQTFLSDHPDFQKDTALRSEVQHLLEQNESLDLETAYWAAKGKQARQAAEQERRTRTARRSAAKQAAMTGTGQPRKSGSHSRPSSKELKSMSTADILAAAIRLSRG